MIWGILDSLGGLVIIRLAALFDIYPRCNCKYLIYSIYV